MQQIKCGDVNRQVEIFKNERFGEVRVAGTSEEPLFCLFAPSAPFVPLF